MLGILLVDPQNDFFPGGSLAVKNGDEIIAPVNELLAARPNAPVFVTRDWHPEKTKHFQENGGVWPPHCVAGSPGAAFAPDLKLPSQMRVYDKGTDPNDDGGYSGFDGHRAGTKTTLLEDLRACHVDSLLVAGLATDYCVKHTVLDALKAGLPTFVYLPGVRAVNLKPHDGEDAISAMRAAGAWMAS